MAHRLLEADQGGCLADMLAYNIYNILCNPLYFTVYNYTSSGETLWIWPSIGILYGS